MRKKNEAKKQMPVMMLKKVNSSVFCKTSAAKSEPTSWLDMKKAQKILL